MIIQKINPLEGKPLIDELDTYQSALYPAESCHLDSIETLQANNVVFLAAIEKAQVIAIGSVKLLGDYGEIKRIYVPTQHRGKRLAQKIIAELENRMTSNGIFLAKLETGPASTEAIALYKKLGYVECEKFGNYKDDPLSVFMEKQL